MKKVFLVALIIFIGLGLPDSVFTATWPEMAGEYSLDLSSISIFTLTVFVATFISTMNYPKLSRRFGFNIVVGMSILLTSIGMFIIFLSTGILYIFLGLIISGLGAGSIDCAINDYASNNFSLSEINVLHGFWGIGVSSSSLLVSTILKFNLSYDKAYLVLGCILFLILLIFRSNNDLFKSDVKIDDKKEDVALKREDYLGIVILCIYSVEFFIGIYLTSYLKAVYNFQSDVIAFILGIYWFGLTFSRIIMPITTKYIKEHFIIIISSMISLVAILLLSFNSALVITVSVLLIGIGFGPIYPTMIHFTSKVAADRSDKIISYQISGWSLFVVMLQLVYGVISMKFGFTSFMYVSFILVFVLVVLIIIYIKNNIEYLR